MSAQGCARSNENDPVSQTLAADERPSAVFRRNFVITTSGIFDPAPLAAAIATVGEDNILFSVDYLY